MNKEEKIVFGLSEGDDNIPLVILGVTTKAWEYMKDGKTHTLDLTRVGFNIRIILYGAANHAAALEMIKGPTTIDKTNEDFTLKDNPDQKSIFGKINNG